MRKYLITLDLGRDIAHPISVTAEDSLQALEKVVKYCKEEGYYPLGIRVHYIYEGNITELN